MRSMTIEKDGDSLVVVFLDRRITEETRIMEIGDELAELASEIPSGEALILDFQHVKILSTATMGQIVQLRNAAERDGVELRLRHVDPAIREILHEMHLDELLLVESSCE